MQVLTFGATHHQTLRAARNGPALQELVHHYDEGNSDELMTQTLPCNLEDQLYCAKVTQSYFIS